MIRNISQFAELMALLWCMANLFGKKLKLSRYTIAFILFDLIVFAGINQGNFPKFFLVFIYFSLLIYGLLYYKVGIKVTLLNCFLTVVIVLILQMIIYLPIYYFFINGNSSNEFNSMLINILSLIVIVLLGKAVKWKEFSDFLLKHNIFLVGILIFVCICLGKEIYLLKKAKTVFARDYIQILLFFILFFFTINEWKKAQVEAERKKAQIEINKLYYAAYDELIVLIRERQHDLKNHINAIYSMIYTTDNYDDLAQMQKEYCQCLLDKNEETKLLLSSGNPLITGFMYSKIKEAEKQGIRVKYNIEIEEMKLKVLPEYEIIEMMGILFDNAMEALETQEVDKIIYISVIYKNEKLDISVANRSEEFSYSKIEEFFRWNFSTKGIGHGIGLAKLKKMVHENAGEIVVSNEEYESINFLQFEIYLPLCYE